MRDFIISTEQFTAEGRARLDVDRHIRRCDASHAVYYVARREEVAARILPAMPCHAAPRLIAAISHYLLHLFTLAVISRR